jgi:hypothetical protein
LKKRSKKLLIFLASASPGGLGTEKLRADMANEQRKMRLEDRRLYLQISVAFAAVFAAGVSLALMWTTIARRSRLSVFRASPNMVLIVDPVCLRKKRLTAFVT